MATDFRVRGGTIEGATAQQRLQHIDQAEARVLLRQIESQITSPKGVKSGVLKLVNLNDATKNVTLERKSFLQRMFSKDGKDMRTTADTLKLLFEKAGVAQDVRADLDRYLARKDNRAGTVTMAKLIDAGLKTVGAVSGDSKEAVLTALGIQMAPRPDGQQALKGYFGEAHLARRANDPADRIYKEIPLDSAKPLELSQTLSKTGAPQLVRSGAAGSSYIGKQIPGIVRPEVYVVTETDAVGNETFHGVEGDKNLKKWAAQYLKDHPGIRLHVTGVLMAKAQGVSMATFGAPTEADQSALHNAALDGLKTLKQMSQRGFIHADIKPANLYLDPQAGTIQFIDTDAMLKMRSGQQAGEEVRDLASRGFAHPGAFREGDANKVGFEHDLFALGLSVLVSSFPNDDNSIARRNNLLNAVGGYNTAAYYAEPGKPLPPDLEHLEAYWERDDQNFEKLRSNIRTVLNADPAVSLSKTQIMALNWMDAALDCQQPVTQRYGSTGAGQRAEHLLDRVDPSKHPQISSQLSRPLVEAH